MIGIINRWTDRGFGFVRPLTEGANTEAPADIFAHISECQGFEPTPGLRVAYEEQIDSRTGRLRAVNVRPLGRAE